MTSLLRPKTLILLFCCLAGIGALYLYLPLGQWFDQFQELIRNFTDWVKDFGPLGWFVFILVYALMTFLLIPGSFLTLAAGLIWGFGGIPIVLVAALAASCMSFLAARYLFHDWVQAKVAKYPRFDAVNQAIGEEDWKIVFLLRLSPALPFSLQNWFLGLTPAAFVPAQIATFFGIIPGTALYVWIGSLGGELAQGETGWVNWLVRIFGLVATLAVTVLVTRKAQAKLKGFNVS